MCACLHVGTQVRGRRPEIVKDGGKDEKGRDEKGKEEKEPKRRKREEKDGKRRDETDAKDERKADSKVDMAKTLYASEASCIPPPAPDHLLTRS